MSTAARDLWLAELEHYTLGHRRARAEHHSARALAAVESCKCQPTEDGTASIDPETGEVTTRRLAGKLTCMHRTRAAWHASRAKGYRRRFERVSTCGDDVIRIKCRHCKGLHREVRSACGEHRACTRCRGLRAYRIKKKFRDARRAALRRYHRAGQRWGESFLTLTWPDSDDPAADAQGISDAFPKFMRRVRDWLWATGRVRRVMLNTGNRATRDCVPFLRVLEATPGWRLAEEGTVRAGHAHLHCWYYAPFIPHQMLRLWWAEVMPPEIRARLPTRSLERVLKDAEERDRPHIEKHAPGEHLPWPVIDVQGCRGNVEEELVKYLIKDGERAESGQWEHVDAASFARLYAALDGRRTCVTSMRFWQLVPLTECRTCTAVGSMEVETLPGKHRDTADVPIRAGPDALHFRSAV